MGFVTLIRVYNDHVADILKDSEIFCEEVYRICASGRGEEFVHGHCETKVFNPIHCDNSSMYLLHGNSSMEMDPYSRETNGLMKRDPEYFGVVLKIMKGKIRQLEKMFAESKKPNER